MKRVVALVICALVVSVTPSRADRAAAQAAHAQGMAALGRRDIDAAEAAFSEAIAADPGWDEAWGMRGRAKSLNARYAAAVEDFTRAIGLNARSPQWPMLRCQSLMAIDHWAEAAEDAETLLTFQPDLPQGLALHGWALVNLGDVDRGLAEQDRAVQGGAQPALLIRFDAYWRKADWVNLVREAEQGIQLGNPRPSLHFYRVVGYVEQGKFAEARAAIQQLRQAAPGTAEEGLSEAYLLGTPSAGAGYDPVAALAKVVNVGGSGLSYMLNTQARVLYLAGRTHECLELLSTRGRRTNFDTLFWTGIAQWKLGQLTEARATLQDARRLNPYLSKHAERFEGFKEFAASIDRDLAGESGQQADRTRLTHELATHLLSVAEIETLVRRYEFARAVAEYEKLQKTLTSAVRKGEVEARLPELRGMSGAHGKIVKGVNAGTLKLVATVGATPLTIVKATDRVFDFTIKGGGGKFPWAFIAPSVYVGFLQDVALTPEETFGAGCLAWEAGDPVIGAKLLEEAVRKKPDLKKPLAIFVARRKGIPVPDGGFVSFRGSYVTAEEKANLEKGLVRFEGQWVPAADRERLAKGEIRVDGKWVPGDEGELLKRGYRKYKGKWMNREDYEVLRGQWADCYTEETAHYVVKTNLTESYARDLAVLVEVAWGELKTFYGGAEPKLPGKEKMTLHAYRSYEDYRQYCVENKAEDQLNAAGFARSDSNIVVGWNKTGNARQFLQTMVHEAAHLYFFRVQPAARPVSWYAEGSATYFEGFRWDGKSYIFDFISDSRLPFARDAMKGGRHIALKDLLDGNALQLINSDTSKALLFYAECWALNYYLSRTEDKAVREAYAAYRADVAKGGTKGLLEYFPDPVKLEKDWVAFISGL